MKTHFPTATTQRSAATATKVPYKRVIGRHVATLIILAAVIGGAVSPAGAHAQTQNTTHAAAVEIAHVEAQAASTSVLAADDSTISSQSNKKKKNAYDYLPMVRWTGGTHFIRADAREGLFGMGGAFSNTMNSAADMLAEWMFRLSGTIWGLVATINEWSSTETLKDKFLDPVNQGFANIAGVLVSTGVAWILLGAAMIAIVWSLLRMRVGETLRRLVNLLLIGGTFFYLLFGSLAGFDDSNGNYSEGSPAWFAAISLDTLSAPLNSQPFDVLVQTSARSGKSVYSCQAYMNNLYDKSTGVDTEMTLGHSDRGATSTITRRVGRVDSVSVALSRLWERAWYDHYGMGQFGDYEIGRSTACRALEATSARHDGNTSLVAVEQASLQAEVAPVKADVILVPDSTHSSEVRNFQARQLALWASCGSPESFKMHAKTNDCSEIMAAGSADTNIEHYTFDEQSKSLAKRWDSVGTFGNNSVTKPWAVPDIRERIDEKGAGNAEGAAHQQLAGISPGLQLDGAFISLLNAVIVLLYYGGLLFGVTFSTAVVMAGFMMLPIVLLAGLIPGRGSSIAKRGLSFVGGAIAAKLVITVLLLLHLTIVLAILAIVEQFGVGYGTAWMPGITIIATSWVLGKFLKKLGVASAFSLNPLQGAVYGATAPAALAAGGHAPNIRGASGKMAAKYKEAKSSARALGHKAKAVGGLAADLGTGVGSVVKGGGALVAAKTVGKGPGTYDSRLIQKIRKDSLRTPEVGRTATGQATPHLEGDYAREVRQSTRSQLSRMNNPLEAAQIFERRIRDGLDSGKLEDLTDAKRGLGVHIDGDRIRIEGDASHPANMLPSSVLKGAQKEDYNSLIYGALASSGWMAWDTNEEPVLLGNAVEHLDFDGQMAVSTGDYKNATYNEKIRPHFDTFSAFWDISRPQGAQDATAANRDRPHIRDQQMMPPDVLTAQSERLSSLRNAYSTTQRD